MSALRVMTILIVALAAFLFAGCGKDSESSVPKQTESGKGKEDGRNEKRIAALTHLTTLDCDECEISASDDLRHVGIVAIFIDNQKNGVCQLWVDDRMLGEFPGSRGVSDFSPDGSICTSFIYNRRPGFPRFLLIVNGKSLNVWGGIVEEFVYSPVGNRMGYTVSIYDDDHGYRMFAVIDDKKGNIYGSAGCIEFSPDGKRYVYYASIGSGLSDKEFLIIDGEKQTEYEDAGGCCFSPDSRHFAYFAADFEGEKLLIVDGHEQYLDVYEVTSHSLVYSSDSRRLAYSARKDGKGFAVVDGKRGKAYDSVGEIVFSPDSTRYAYAVCQDGRFSVVLDGKESDEKYYEINSLEFSFDSRRFAYKANTGNIPSGVPPDARISGDKWMVVVDGVEGKQCDVISPWLCFCEGNGASPLFAPNAEHVAYLAIEDDEYFAVAFGIESERYEYADGINHSPDGSYVAFKAGDKDKEFIVISPTTADRGSPLVDDSSIFDKILGPDWPSVIWDSPAKFHYLARDGDKIYLVEEEIIEE